jgi:hypothetical protein
MSAAEGPPPPDAGPPGVPGPSPVAPTGGMPPPVPPPGGAPYGYGPDLIGGRDTGERARKALWVGLIAFGAQAVASVVVIATLSEWYLDLLEAIGSGRRLTTAQTTPPTSSAYLIATGVSQLAGIAVLVVGIVFLIWFHKALSNARALGLPLTRSPGWGVAGFFIPIVNFWFPYQSMRDLLPEGNPARPLVGRWWACYLGASFVTVGAQALALFAPAVGIAISPVVVVLYAVAAITLRQLISASTEAAHDIVSGVAPGSHGWGTPVAATADPTAPAPGGPAGAPGSTPGWAPPPVVAPKDPWNRS